MTTLNAPMSSTTPPIALPAAAAAIAAAAQRWRALVSFAQAWSAARRRAADDRDALANMSDRELQDIGISRATAGAVVEGHRFNEPDFR